jgi:hypothetical protein
MLPFSTIRRSLPILLLALAPAAIHAGDEEPGADPAFDVKVLSDAGVASDPAGLIAFFHSRTPSPTDQARLAARIQDLGSEAFQVRDRASRQLTEASRFALPLLRGALGSTDLEVARRAARCIEDIEQSPTSLVMGSAARLTATTRPAGAAEALVGVLPAIEDEAAEEAVFRALAVVGLKSGVAEAEVVAAAADKHPLKRAAAGFVLGQAAPEQRNLAVRLLADADPRVRFRSAAGLLRSGDRAAVPALIALLDEGPVALVWRAEELLDRLAGELDLPAATGTDEVTRHRARLAWEQWWRANATRVDFGRITREEEYLGLNLIVELDAPPKRGEGRVWESGIDGKPRWEIRNLQRPIDAKLLPNGRVLIAEHGGPRVTERQRDGTVVWEFTPPGQPVSCQRLANGNTFIATYNELVEVNQAKTVVFSVKLPTNMVFCGRRLRNGHCVYVSSTNHIVELDATGKEVHSISLENTGGWASLELLANGGYLLALFNAKKVIEVDQAGKVLWQCAVAGPGHATRLRNGNTLVTSIEGCRIAEYDRSGKEVWRQVTPGRPFRVYRR